MNDLESMYHIADECGEATNVIESGIHVDELRIEVETDGYLFRTDGRSFSVIKNKRQPINYNKTGTV